MKNEAVLPFSAEAERALLGCLTQGTEASRDALGKALAKVAPVDFYPVRHRRIYEGIHAIAAGGGAPTVLGVAEHLRSHGGLAPEDEKYLGSLLDDPFLATNVEEYIEVVKDKALSRRLTEVGSELYRQALEEAHPAEELLGRATTTLLALTEARQEGATLCLASLLNVEEAWLRAYNPAAPPEDSAGGLLMGIAPLDMLTCGLHRGDLFIVAGRPGNGKTSLALNIARNIIEKGARVVFFSMEMTARSLAVRLMCSTAGVNSQHLRQRSLFPEDQEKLISVAEYLAQFDMHVDESPHLSPLLVRTRAQPLLRAGGRKGAIFIDYLQLMDCSRRKGEHGPENRQQEITSICRDLKAIARELDVPIVLLSQLSRESERREDRRPRLSDLRDSGAIEQDADAVLFLHRPGELPEDASAPLTMEMVLAKQRSGPAGAFGMTFNRKFTRFEGPGEMPPEKEINNG